MLKLEVGRLGLQKEIIKFALHHVIRNGKRWGRYEMDLSKDCKRVKTLLHRTTPKRWQEACNMEAPPILDTLTGFKKQNRNDLIAFFGNDLLEVIAIMEYWGLWQYSSEFLLKA